jgi:hypothetical protein
VLIAFNFSDATQTIEAPSGEWRAIIHTGAKLEGTRLTLPPTSFALLGV